MSGTFAANVWTQNCNLHKLTGHTLLIAYNPGGGLQSTGEVLVSQGTLTAFALPAMYSQAWDHVYVTSSGGHAWGCWGRNSGGLAICSGIGNIDQADCLAQANARAGVLYGFTGVCHQAANRILSVAGLTVSGVRGYRRSFFAYGAYGRDLLTLQRYSPVGFPWPELQLCTASHNHT